MEPEMESPLALGERAIPRASHLRTSRRWRRRRRREALHEWRRRLLLPLVVALHIIIAEDHATLRWLVLHRRRAIRGRRLLGRRNVVEPDAAHARGRPILGRNIRRLLLTTTLRAQSGRGGRGQQKCEGHSQLLHLSSDRRRPSGAHRSRSRPDARTLAVTG